MNKHDLKILDIVWKVGKIIKIGEYHFQNVGFGKVFNIEKQELKNWRELKMTNNKELEQLRKNAEELESNLADSGNLWLPMKSNLLKVKEDTKERVYVDDITEEQKREEFIKSIIPKGLVSHEGDYGLQYHLEFINVFTGEIERVPLTAQLKSKLESLWEIEEIELKEGDFEFAESSDYAVSIRYCGKLKSMQQGDKRNYHTWTGEKIG